MIKSFKEFPRSLFLVCILLGFGFRLVLTADKQVLEFDDAISVLTATGHEGEFIETMIAQSYPIGEWVQVDAWKRMIEVEPGYGFGQIAKDLFGYDIHPPLYFWVLHAWIVVFGNSIRSLQLLNIAIDLLILLSLICLGNRVFKNSTQALLVGAIWILSPVAIKTTYWIRQYDLLILMGVLYALLLHKSFTGTQPFRWLSWINLCLILVVIAGILTHFYFAFFILASLLVIKNRLAHFLQNSTLRIGFALLVTFFGLASLLFLQAHNFSFLSFAQSRVLGLDENYGFTSRIQNALKTTLILVSPVLTSIGLDWFDLLATYWQKSNRLRLILRFGQPEPGQPAWRSFVLNQGVEYFKVLNSNQFFRWSLWFAVLPYSIALLIYMAGFSQVHTFSSRYLGFVTPFLAFLAVFIILKAAHWIRLSALQAGIMILFGLVTITPVLAQSQEGTFDPKNLWDAKLIVVDSIDMGAWPAVVQFLKPDQLIYIDTQSNLFQKSERLTESVGAAPLTYVSFVRGEPNTREGRNKILNTLTDQYRVELLSEVKRPQDWEIAVFRLTPIGLPAN